MFLEQQVWSASIWLDAPLGRKVWDLVCGKTTDSLMSHRDATRRTCCYQSFSIRTSADASCVEVHAMSTASNRCAHYKQNSGIISIFRDVDLMVGSMTSTLRGLCAEHKARCLVRFEPPTSS